MVVLQSNCFMDRRLKMGLVCMVAAVILMPLAILVKDSSQTLTFAVLLVAMVLELIGLLFVIITIVKRKKV